MILRKLSEKKEKENGKSSAKVPVGERKNDEP